MKKFAILSFLAFVIVACHRKTVAVAPATTTQTSVPTNTASEEAAKHKELITQGKTIYINRCGRCHGLKPVNKWPAEEWTEILKTMIPKARLNDLEAEQVRAYVMENVKRGP